MVPDWWRQQSLGSSSARCKFLLYFWDAPQKWAGEEAAVGGRTRAVDGGVPPRDGGGYGVTKSTLDALRPTFITLLCRVIHTLTHRLCG